MLPFVETFELIRKVINPPARAQLSRLCSVLTCPVCYSTVTRPVSTQCGHTFCSLCIRTSLQFQLKCPQCFLEVGLVTLAKYCDVQAHETQLRPDRSSELLLQQWPGLLASVGALARGEGGKGVQEESKENDNPNSPVPCKPSVPSAPSSVAPSSLSCVSQAASSPCPLCGVVVASSHSTKHQANCQALLDGSKKPQAPPPPKLPPLPKVVYAILKEPDLRRRCRDVGLNSKGDKTALVKRLKKFTLLYNLEREEETPRSKSSLAAQVAREEQEEERGTGPTPLLQWDRNRTDTSVIEEKKKTYLQQNSEAFSDLVKKARNKKRVVSDKTTKAAEADVSTKAYEAIAATTDIIRDAIEESACSKEVAKITQDSSKVTINDIIEISENDATFETAPETISAVSENIHNQSSFEKQGQPGDGAESFMLEAAVANRSIQKKSSLMKLDHDNVFLNKTSDTATVTQNYKSATRNQTWSGEAATSTLMKTPTKGGVGAVYLTPTKTQVMKLAKSPKMKTSNIIDALNQSVEVVRRSNVQCPVCDKVAC